MKHYIAILKDFLLHADTSLTKLVLGLSSIGWSSLEAIVNNNFSLWNFVVFTYGICLFAKLFQDERRVFRSYIVSTVGAFIWTNQAWETILSHEQLLSHVCMATGYALAALWLFFRCESSTNINKVICATNSKHCPYKIER